MVDKLKDKLLKLKEGLAKAMKQGGIGGKGAVKLGAILPSIKSVTSAGKAGGNNSTTPSLGMTQPSKKNPIKQAEQIQNKDIKDIKMSEAKSKIKSMDVIKFDDNGQWSLDKSGYKGYTETDNIKRKANNTGEDTGIHSMNRIKQYGGSGANAAGREAAKMKRKSKKNPVKVYSKEEIAAFNAERNK